MSAKNRVRELLATGQMFTGSELRKLAGVSSTKRAISIARKCGARVDKHLTKTGKTVLVRGW